MSRYRDGTDLDKDHTTRAEAVEADLSRDSPEVEKDAVFGEITERGPNYRNVGWLGTVALMMKTQVGLGVLSIPTVFSTLGLIPGIIGLLCIGTITTWSGYIVGVFKLNHPNVYGIDDVGALLFGRLGREVLGIAFSLYLTCIAGSGMLSIAISLNAVSDHGTCTAVFLTIAALIGFGLGSIQTLGRITWLAWVGLTSIVAAVFTLTVAVGVQDRPAAAPQTGPWSSDYKLFKSADFQESVVGLASLVFAYAGTPAFFSIASEMRDPRFYARSLIMCQAGVSVIYIVVGIVVYYCCGSYVASPALGSAGVIMKKVCYGLALPGLIVTTTLYTHFPAKYFFVRALRGSRHLSKNTLIHWLSWLGCTFGIAMIAYIIASAIPVFGGLVSLIGALLGTLMSFQPMGCMWLYDNWHRRKTGRTTTWTLMVVWSVFVIVAGSFLMVAGTYASVVGIKNDYESEGGSAAWSCDDNSTS